LETFGKPEWIGFQRCTSLIWNVYLYSLKEIQDVVDLIPKRLVSLKLVSFTNFTDPIGESQFPNCPVLERVEFLGHGGLSPHFWGTNFLCVTTLSVGYNTSYADFNLTMLSLFPVLRDLTLFTLKPRITNLLFDNTTPPIHFRLLHILRAHGCIPPKVLTRLVAPALEEVHLTANAHNRTSIDTLQTSFNPLCLDIHALLPKAVAAEEPKWAENLSKLVQKCTRIRSVYISRWMEEECRKFMSGQHAILRVQ